MPLAILLNNSKIHSWSVIGGYFRQSLEEQGITVIEKDLPQGPEGRKMLRDQYPDAIFFHNTMPAPGLPLTDPNCVPDIRWEYLGYRSDVIEGATNILLPAYEFSRLPDPWVTLYNRYSEIWTTTRHVGELLKHSGVTRPILRLPPALDREVIPQKRSYEVPSGKPFQFLFVGEPIWRKGVHFLMYGFLKAFPKVGQAELIIKTAPNKDWVSLREDIKFITDKLPREDFLQLYTSSDCYISASLAEGLGLPIAEAIRAGLPVCTNNWGGHRDLLTGGGYFPLDFIEADRPWNGVPQFYTPGQKCALSDENSVARAMLKVVKSSARTRQKMALKAQAALQQSYGATALRLYWAHQIQRLYKAAPAQLEKANHP